MIGRKAETILNRAVRYAVEQEHEYFTLEHVLWSLLSDSKISETVAACGGSPAGIRLELEKYLQNEIPKAALADELSPADQEGDSDHNPEHPVATLSIQRLIQRALFHVQSAGKDEIQPEDLLVAMFQAKDSKALLMLTQQGIERLDVLNYISHGITPEHAAESDKDLGPSDAGLNGSAESPDLNHSEGGPDFEGEGSFNAGNASHSKRAARKGEDPLSLFTTNLNERALAGKLDPLIGRQNELERIIQTLCRRRKNNPLLVGEAGVGKTSLAEGLASRIVEKQIPEPLAKGVVYSLDLGSLLAGAKFRGDFEQRFKKVLSELEAKKEKGFTPILFIDEIHTIIGAGAVSGGALDAANLIKPLLSQGEIRCLGSTTYAEYRSVFEKDHALVRRFQKIDVTEPTQEESIQILNGIKGKLEEHHGVTYTPEAIRAAVELSHKHLTDRFLPDKAIDVLDEAGAKAKLTQAKVSAMTQVLSHPMGDAPSHSKRDAMADAPDGANDEKLDALRSEPPKVEKTSLPPTVIDHAFIEEVIAQIARIPARSVSTGQKTRLKNLRSDLKLSIFGQDPAVDALVTSIRLARSGLRTGERPVGSFLFCGPTGVGKTELSRQLAHCLGVPFLRYDMSEYGEKHTVSRLIGAPPGYVGFEQAGLLTDSVIKNPHSIVLLDEIEKAHPDIWNILLQVMDHGFLTDSNGRKADFRNVILIMTSNVGSRELERRPLGMGADDSIKGVYAQKAVEQTFSPEFRNRLDSIVYFNPLDPKTVVQVVSKQLMELEAQLLAKNVDVDVTTEVRDWLAKKGYDRLMGARPLARVIQDQIKKPLSEEILFGKLENGGKVRITIQNGECVFDVVSTPPNTPEVPSRVAENHSLLEIPAQLE